MALRADVQAQLRYCHDELGFRHVRFHGLLADDMGTLICHRQAIRIGFPVYFCLNQGPSFLMIENYRTGLLWQLMRQCSYVVPGCAGLAFRMVGCNATP